MKVFEIIVHNQFHTHITTNNILNPNQSGFRPKHSTTTALIDVTDHLYNQSQNGLITGAIFLDLKKAFDTVNPVILQEKLRAIGVHGTELQWFDNYFTNRTHVVSANGAVSTTQPISCGVPQGSILGPLLFTLYVNDLSSVAVHGKVVLYADDTAIFVSGKNIEDIQGKLNSDLERISAWLYANKLTLNANKTKTMLFGTNQRLARLEQVPCFKYLGLHFVPRANSTAAKNMFAYEGAVLYNGLPMVLKSADNFIDFKRICNSHFKNMYDLSG